MSDALFAPLESFAAAWLDVGEGHRIYFEQCGNPQGVPALFLHGGPGSSINPTHRRFFDPAYYRVILFDQRGCGRSTPKGETNANTTPNLIEDIEAIAAAFGDRTLAALRRQLGKHVGTRVCAGACGCGERSHPARRFPGRQGRGQLVSVGLARGFCRRRGRHFTQSAVDKSPAGLLRHYYDRDTRERSSGGIALERVGERSAGGR